MCKIYNLYSGLQYENTYSVAKVDYRGAAAPKNSKTTHKKRCL